jgi:hypothetical protein
VGQQLDGLLQPLQALRGTHLAVTRQEMGELGEGLAQVPHQLLEAARYHPILRAVGKLAAQGA